MIFGAGAIGGVVGARLHQSGRSVVLIARGAHLDAIRHDGLRVRTPSEDLTVRIPAAATAAEASVSAEDVVLLCTKSQDTEGALRSIRDSLTAAGPLGPRPTPPIVCLQNGVENERAALRLFGSVYGAVVMVPAEHLEPGLVLAYGSKLSGRIDVGRYPTGLDDTARELCAALSAARFESEPRADIMVHKYAKLISNLVNAIEAVCGQRDPDANRELMDRAREEGRAALRAAGIEFEVEDVSDMAARWERIGVGEVDGHSHRGGSSWQSVLRGTGSIETDHLTGEVVLLARRYGIDAPANELLADLAARTISEGREPGWLDPREILAAISDR